MTNRRRMAMIDATDLNLLIQAAQWWVNITGRPNLVTPAREQVIEAIKRNK